MEKKDDSDRSGLIEIALNVTLPRILYEYDIAKEVALGNKEAIALSAMAEMRLY